MVSWTMPQPWETQCGCPRAGPCHTLWIIEVQLATKMWVLRVWEYRSFIWFHGGSISNILRIDLKVSSDSDETLLYVLNPGGLFHFDGRSCHL